MTGHRADSTPCRLDALAGLVDRHRTATRALADAGDPAAARHLRHIPRWPVVALVHLQLIATATAVGDDLVATSSVAAIAAAAVLPAATVRDALQLLDTLEVWTVTAAGNRHTAATRLHRGHARTEDYAEPDRRTPRDVDPERGHARAAAPAKSVDLDHLVVAAQPVAPLVDQLRSELGADQVDVAVAQLVARSRRSSTLAELERRIRHSVTLLGRELTSAPVDDEAADVVVAPPAGLPGPAAPYVDVDALRRARERQAAAS